MESWKSNQDDAKVWGRHFRNIRPAVWTGEERCGACEQNSEKCEKNFGRGPRHHHRRSNLELIVTQGIHIQGKDGDTYSFKHNTERKC